MLLLYKNGIVNDIMSLLFSQVTVALQTNCSGVVPVGLVLISDRPLIWDLQYENDIYLMQGYVSHILWLFIILFTSVIIY